MIGQKETYYRFILGRRSRKFFLFFALMTTAFLLACSNSQSPETDNPFSQDDIEQNLFSSEQPASSSSTSASSTSQQSESSSSKTPASSSYIKEYLPLDDTEYPYAGIPRIVIETENHRQILDRETEIPAKLQIYGKIAPESEIIDLTIRGRGNSTWFYPKKPYLIKLNTKKSLFGMAPAKKWVLLANYIDRTLMRNAVSLEIARKTELEWTPRGVYVDVYLNKKFLGNYYLCEKIEVKKNRLNLSENSFLLEFDSYYDEKYKFRTPYGNFPVNIKYPENPSNEQISYIKNYIDSLEYNLYKEEASKFADYIDIKSLIDFFIVYEISMNEELQYPKSIYTYKEDNEKLKFGPVWDFDWVTFTSKKKDFRNRYNFWFKKFSYRNSFNRELQKEWNLHKQDILKISSYIDSLADYTRLSNEQNIKKWPITAEKDFTGENDKDFNTAISMFKEAFINRINELDVLINNLL